MLLRLLAIAFSLTFASGCATVTRGTTESFLVESEPPGASVTSSAGWTCKTPCSVQVKRRGDFTVTLEKEGYEPAEATVTSSIDGAGSAGMAGNVLLGGLIGAGIDAGSGAMHSHKPNPLQINLVPLGEKPPADESPDAAESDVAVSREKSTAEVAEAATHAESVDDQASSSTEPSEEVSEEPSEMEPPQATPAKATSSQ